MAIPSDNDGINDILGTEDDSVEGVSDNIYEWDFDQVAVVGLPSIPDEERSVINWYCPEHLKTTKILRYAANQYEISFTEVVTAALPHGYAILTHELADAINVITALDSAAVVNDGEDYFNHLIYKPVVGKDVRRLLTATSRETAEAMGNTSSILGTSRSHFAGACILRSVSTSSVLPVNAVKYLEKHVAGFVKGVELYQKLATSLI